jgi:hypothetical protein
LPIATIQHGARCTATRRTLHCHAAHAALQHATGTYLPWGRVLQRAVLLRRSFQRCSRRALWHAQEALLKSGKRPMSKEQLDAFMAAIDVR